MIAPVTLYREVDALGGTPREDYERGYNTALRHVLEILVRRGFSELADAEIGQHVAYFDEGAFQWMSGIAPRECELFALRTQGQGK